MDKTRDTYETERSGYWLYESKVAAKVGAILVPAGGSLDYFVYADQFGQFSLLRILCTLAISSCLLIYRSGIGRRHVRSITFGWLFLVQVMICYMIHITDGVYSTYYAGLNLPVLALAIVLPSSMIEVLVFCLLTLSLYSASCWTGGQGLDDFPIVFNNLFFLVANAIIAVTAAYFLERRRYTEFQLKYEVEMHNRELADLDRQKSQFFANVSHELRTPLTLILAPVQELLEGGHRIPDFIAGRIGIVRDNALRLLKLVNDLLDVIRLEEGKERMERKPIELNGILSALVDSMTHLADTKEIVLHKQLVPGALVVRGDVRALEKIFVNLLNNAVKFTENGGSVEVKSVLDGERVRVEISDTGIGIEYDQLPYIFDRFHQVDGSSTRRYQGTGLGLALVKEMAEKLGGSVQVLSTPGSGTCMAVELPHCRERPAARDVDDATAEDGLAHMHRVAELTGGLSVDAPPDDWNDLDETADGRRPTILVVDDEPDMRRYLVGILEPDYRVLQARDGREGLQLALEQRPDLVVLDLMLPEMDGLEVCRHIRRDVAGWHQKIMLLTARVDEQAKIKALEHGADDFLTKPFSSLEVKTRLNNLLDRARLERDLAERNAGLQRALTELKATQSQLIQSEKLNALGSLSAGLLHEINNPLNYSLTALQLIQGDALVRSNALLHEVVSDIDEGMQRIRAIVSDLRAFAYPSEAEKQRPFDFREAVESALRFTAHEIKSVQLVQALPAQTRVLGSKNHMVQVLINLLSNALRAVAPLAGERSAEIRIDGRVADGRLLVEVSDNGVGMDENTLNRIFDPFFTTREVGDGMGLGLSICHTIIVNHGGSLAARSRPGEGSRLSFDLPLAMEGSG